MSIYFLLESFVSCPLSTGKALSRLPMLLRQSLLCLLAHKYLQFKASMVPSTNRKEYSWESSGSLPYGTGALFPTQNHTNTLGWGSFGQRGTGTGQWEKGPPNKWPLAEEECVKRYSSAQFTGRLMQTYVTVDQPVNLDWFLYISCLSALLLITSHRKTAPFLQTANKTW